MKASTISIAFLLVAVVMAKSPHNDVEKMTQSTENDIVDTNVGKIRGLKITAVNGKSLWAFRGIPYALPPVGKLRFAMPVAYPKAKSIVDAKQQKAFCIKNLSPNQKTSEDCLYLNIFLKDVNNQLGTKKKVLVSFYDSNEMSHDPGSFVTDHDIIVVTVQHRVGPFGYLVVNAGGLLGNYGLWDQLSALKWIKSNIGAFGGDADDITVAGDDFVGCLALTPMANGLFTKVLATGGMSGHPQISRESSDKDLIEIAMSMNCWEEENVTELSREDKLDVIQCLRSLPTIDPSKTELFNKTYIKSWSSFVPVIDGELIPKSFSALYKDDQYLEKIGFYQKKYFITVNNNIKYSWAEEFTYIKRAFQEARDDDADNLKFWYDYSLIWAKVVIAKRLNTERVSDDLVKKIVFWYQTNTHLDPITELQTDLRYTVRTYDFLDTVARSARSNVWLLHFNHYPDYLKDDAHGMIYNIDLLYLFDVDMSFLRALDDPYVIGTFGKEDDQIKESFSSLIAAFVKDGSPDAPLLTEIPTGWPIYDLVGRHYLDFKSRPTVKRNWKKEIRVLWQQDVPYWAYKQMEKWHLEL